MAKFVSITIGVLALIGAIVVVIWAIRYYTAPIKGAVNAQEQIQSAPSRIGAYNYFFNLCASIQGDESALDAIQDELEATTDLKEQARIRANSTGVKAQRQRSIAEYNASARKDYTIGQFRDSDLPYQLDRAEYKKGGRTSCGNK